MTIDGFHTERDVFVQEELEEDDQYDGQKLDEAALPVQLVDAHPQDEVAEHQAAQTHSQEYGKSAKGLVFHLEVVCPVQKETGGDADQHRDTIRQQIIQSRIMGQKRENHKVERGGEAPDDSVEDKITELPVEGSNDVHFYQMSLLPLPRFGNKRWKMKRRGNALHVRLSHRRALALPCHRISNSR